jgi:competence protein ComEC
MRKTTLLAAASLAALTFVAPITSAPAQTRATLDIYVVDVEGGNATLFVTPAGESLLIDTGNYGPEVSKRDAARIMEAARDARLTQIDHLITTHWHGDHFGGMGELAKMIPIKHFIDHGPNQQPAPNADEFLSKIYPGLIANAKHTVAKVGDKIDIKGLDIQVVTSNGDTLKTPLAGAGGPNPYCASFKDGTTNIEDPLSVGVHITFGKFRTMHLGDVPKGKEFQLMCPINRIGTIDVFLGLHHAVNTSTSPVIMHATRPRVAVVNNGTRKGAQPDVMQVIFSSPGFEDLWQIHFSQLSGQEYTVPGLFIANLTDAELAAASAAAMPTAAIAAPTPGPNTPPPPVHNGKAYWIKVSAKTDGGFSVTNARNGFTKTYAAGTQ